ncbi:MAG: hypothetical protein EBT61_22025 [Verrucomicrobia bacterium]|nr:hypothetical protein [Verrucomicrobiota bacterium]
MYVWKQSTTSTALEIQRYSKAGVLDTYKVTLTDVSASQVKGVGNDGSVYVAKSLTLGQELLRYKADGTLDTTLGTAGHLNLVNAVQVVGAPTTTGWMYVLESVSDTSAPASSHLEVHRYSATTGQMDSGFKVAFTATSADASNNTFAVRRGVYGDDSVYVMQTLSSSVMVNGVTTNTSSVQVQRYTSLGALDSHFGITVPNAAVSSGFATLDLGVVRSIGGGGALVESMATVNGTMQTVLQHYKIDGTLDTSYGSGGKLVIPTGGHYALVPAGVEVVDAAGQVKLYGSEGHEVTSSAVAGTGSTKAQARRARSARDSTRCSYVIHQGMMRLM